MTTVGTRSVLRRLIGFGVVPFLSLAAPFLLLPVLARSSTPAEWSAIAVGQAASVIISTITSYGWNLRGVVEAARSDGRQQQVLWSEFLYSSTLLFAASSAVVAGLLLVVLPGTTGWLGATVAVANGLVGLAPSWLSIARGRPGELLAYSALPRITGVAVAGAAIALGADLYVYPTVLAVFSAGGIAAYSLGNTRLVSVGLASVSGRLRKNFVSSAASLTDAVYSGGFLVVAALFVPTGAMPALASADRLFRFAKQATATLTNALQSWVVHVEPAIALRRQRQSVIAHASLGAVGALAFAILGPWFSRMLFGTDLGADGTLMAAFGLAFFVTSVSSALAKHVMMTRDLDSSVFWSTLAGLIVAGIGVPVLGLTAGTVGAAIGYAAAEMVVLVYRLLSRGARSLVTAEGSLQ